MNELAAMDMSFGGFSVGGLQLALPMAALREVVSCSSLTDLPCPAACVIGGIDVRGMVIPVVDLRIVLGRPAPAGGGRNVVIVAHGDKIMGLLADSVSGIFEAVDGSYKRMSVVDPTAAVFMATVQRSDNRTMVSVLSTEALSRLHQVPLVDDPESARAKLHAVADLDGEPDPTVPLLLLRCNGIPFAVEAMVVHAALSNPVIEVAELTGLDVIAYDGFKVPVLDLLALCGLGDLDRTNAIQALVVSFADGYVAFLISAVVDVIRARADDVKKLPAFAFAQTGLIAGSLPVSALPAEFIARADESVNQYLVIDAARLKARDEVVALSQVNVATGGEHVGRKGLSDTGPARVGRSMITYMLETERASPLEHVLEILAYEPSTERFQAGGAMLGLMLNRGRSIPVLCLGQVSGEACGAPTAASRVLVVKSGGELIGFAVRKLNSIEQADWEPPAAVAAENGAPPNSGRARKLALFGSRKTDRMVPIFDLQAIAQSLRVAVG